MPSFIKDPSETRRAVLFILLQAFREGNYTAIDRQAFYAAVGDFVGRLPVDVQNILLFGNSPRNVNIRNVHVTLGELQEKKLLTFERGEIDLLDSTWRMLIPTNWTRAVMHDRSHIGYLQLARLALREYKLLIQAKHCDDLV